MRCRSNGSSVSIDDRISVMVSVMDPGGPRKITRESIGPFLSERIIKIEEENL